MARKRKNSGNDLLENLRGPQSDNSNFPSEVETTNEGPNLSSNDDNLTPSSSDIGTFPREKDEPLLVTIRDIATEIDTKKKLTAKDIWQLEKNEKVKVSLNGNGHGDDEGSNLLVRFLGTIARNPRLCPLNIKNWHYMPKDKKTEQWKIIEENFLFDYAAGCKWVMSSLGERFKNYKHELRCKYFRSDLSMEELLANCPPKVDSAEWSIFVRYYQDEKVKAMCSQNANNRKKLKIPHAGGSKSNARKGAQMGKKLQRVVCRTEVILSNLMNKNGNYVNEEAADLAAKISEHLEEDQEQAALLGVPSKIFARPNDAIGKVFGPEHPGRVRGMGVGACPSSVFGLQASLVSTTNANISSGRVAQCHVEDLANQVNTLEENLAGYQETKLELSQTQDKLSKTENKLNTLYKFLQDKFGSDVPNLDEDGLL